MIGSWPGLLAADRRPLLILGSLDLLLAGGLGVLEIASTSLLLAELGPAALPPLYIGSAVVLMLSGALLLPLIDRLDRGRFLTSLLAIAACSTLLLAWFGPSAPGLAFRALYLLWYLFEQFLFLQFWIVAAQVCDIRQAKRLFPPLLGLSLLGGFVAAAATSALALRVSTSTLLVLAALLLALGLLPARAVSRAYRARLTPHPLSRPARLEGRLRRVRTEVRQALEEPMIARLAGAFLLAMLLSRFMDYLMGSAASLRFADASGHVDAARLTSFYALLNGTVIGVGSTIQLFMANRLMASLGVARMMLVLPVVLCAGFAFIALTAMFGGGGGIVFLAILAVRWLQKVGWVSLFRSTADLLLNPIAAETRGRARTLRDTLVQPAGSLVGGALLLTLGLDLVPVAVVGLAVALVFVGVAVRLERDYLESLMRGLLERSRFAPAAAPGAASHLAESARAASTVRRELAADDPVVRLIAVRVMAEMRAPGVTKELLALLEAEPDDRVRATLLSALGSVGRGQAVVAAAARHLEHSNSRVRANAIACARRLGVAGSERLGGLLADDAPRVCVNAALWSEAIEAESGRARLLELAHSRHSAERASAMYGLGVLGRPQDIDVIVGGTGDEAHPVRRRAVLSLAQTGLSRALQTLIEIVEEPRGALRYLAARSLIRFGDDAIDDLVLSLWGGDVDTRRHLISALAAIGTPRAVQALQPVLSLESVECDYDSLRLARLGGLPPTDGLRLLQDSLEARVRAARENAVTVLRSVHGQDDAFEAALGHLNHPDPSARARAVEALEVRLGSGLVASAAPMFEHGAHDRAAEHGGTFFQLPSKSPIETLQELTHSRSRWLRALALYALGETRDHVPLENVIRGATDEYDLARANAATAIGRLGAAAGVGALEKLLADESSVVRSAATAALQLFGGSTTGGPSADAP